MKIPSEASRRVARSLLAEGPATAPELADRLDMTPAGVRRHLDSLEADGFIVAGERPSYGPSPSRGRGRPPKIYSISAKGRDAFDQAYDDLALAALRFLDAEAGGQAVDAFAASRAAEMERRYLPLVQRESTVTARAQALVDALTEDGFAAGTVDSTAGVDAKALSFQICQHNCPVAHVAAEFPQLCQMETEAFSRLLGSHVTRLATIAHGDGVCTAVVAPSTTSTVRDRSPERIPS